MRKILFFIGIVLSFLVVRGEDDNSLFQSSTQYLTVGKYADALKGYQQLEKNGIKTAGLFNDMGYVYYKTNQFTLAELYFERASLIAPLDTQLIFNKSKVLAKLDTAVATNNFGFDQKNSQYLKTIDQFNKVVIILLLVVSLVIIALSIGRFNNRKRVVKNACMILVACLFVTFAVTGYLYKDHQAKNYAIVVKNRSPLFLGPTKLAAVNVLLHEGYKVEVINTSADWLEVRDYNNQCGWVQPACLIEIK